MVVAALVATPASDGALARQLAEVFADCTADGPTTFFAPTDAAIEQYLSGNDLERETLFGDAFAPQAPQTLSPTSGSTIRRSF